MAPTVEHVGFLRRVGKRLHIRGRTKGTTIKGEVTTGSKDDGKSGPVVDMRELNNRAFAQNKNVRVETEVKIGPDQEAPVMHGEGSIDGKISESESSGDTDNNDDSSDLWSAAYREAVNVLGKDINRAILKGKSVAQLFKELEKVDSESSKESALKRGMNRLKEIQGPLEQFKVALDLAAPLASIEPTASTVVGVVRSVTQIAITISTANNNLTQQIDEMLKQIAYIDDCDTLGQKLNKSNIFTALVSVYRKLLEFYSAAFAVLTEKGMKMVAKLVLANKRLPPVVDQFLKQADYLHKLVDGQRLKL